MNCVSAVIVHIILRFIHVSGNPPYQLGAKIRRPQSMRFEEKQLHNEYTTTISILHSSNLYRKRI